MALIGKLRDQVDDPHCIGDLAALRARLDALVSHRRRPAWRPQSRAGRCPRSGRAPNAKRWSTEAEKLAESTQWKASGDRFRAHRRGVANGTCMPNASYEQELWKRLSHARSTFEKRRRAWFATRDAERTEAVASRRRLVKEAEALSTSKDWGPTSAAFRSLMQRWKAPDPPPGKPSKSCGPGSKRRRTPSSPLGRPCSTNVTPSSSRTLPSKQELADEAEALLPVSDLNAARTSLRSIQDRWAQIGHVPRADKPAIERRLQQVEQAVRSAEETKWKRTNPEARARAAADRRAADVVDRQARETARRCGSQPGSQAMSRRPRRRSLHAGSGWLRLRRRSASSVTERFSD